MKYIATFFSHFGAIKYNKICKEKGASSKLMPVPRTLSSSCGTCVFYEADEYDLGRDIPEEVEQIVGVLEDGYESYYRAENS